MRKCELTRVKQGQIKVIHWMAYTLTSVSKLLQVGAGSESQRRGEQRPIRILSSEGFRAPAAALGLCVTPTALCPVCHKVLPACGEVNISLKSYLAPQWGVGEVGVLNHPGEFVCCDRLLARVVAIQRKLPGPCSASSGLRADGPGGGGQRAAAAVNDA